MKYSFLMKGSILCFIQQIIEKYNEKKPEKLKF